MLRSGKDEILRGIVYQKECWTMLLQELQIVFTLLTCLSGTSSREKVKDLYYFTWVSLGSWRRKLEFSDIWPYLSTFGHLATSFKTFTVTFTFCPGAWKIHSLTQNAALLRQNLTALELRGYLDINSWLWAFSDKKKLSFAHALSPDILFYRFSQFLLQIHHISLPPISWKFSI